MLRRTGVVVNDDDGMWWWPFVVFVVLGCTTFPWHVRVPRKVLRTKKNC